MWKNTCARDCCLNCNSTIVSSLMYAFIRYQHRRFIFQPLRCAVFLVKKQCKIEPNSVSHIILGVSSQNKETSIMCPHNKTLRFLTLLFSISYESWVTTSPNDASQINYSFIYFFLSQQADYQHKVQW